MQGARVVAAAELRRVYRRPLSWFVLACGEGLMAIYYLLLVTRYFEDEIRLSASGATNQILIPYFFIANLCILLSAPLLSMGAVAGDRRSGMLRFLLTTPLDAIAIVAGKLTALLVLGSAYVVLIAVIPATLFWGTAVDPGVYLSNLVGLVSFTVFHLCLGVAASAWSRTPVAAAFLAYVIAFSLWLAEWAARLDPESTLVGGISTLGRLRGFNQGLINSADLVFFALASLLLAGSALIAINAERDLL